MKKVQSEHDIISEILDGERELYRILIDRYSPMIFHLVRSYEPNEEEVKGMVQAIFVKAYTKLDTFEKRSKFSTWIYSLALNYCRDYAKNIRRKNSRFSELSSSFIDSRKSDDLLPDQLIETEDRINVMLEELEKLPSEQSEPLLMKYRDGMSYKAMSEETGVSVSALKVRVYRAREELKKRIDPEGVA